MSDIEADTYKIEFERIDTSPFDLNAGGGNWSEKFRAFHSKLMSLYQNILPALPDNMEPLGVSFCGILVRQDNGNHYIAVGVVDGEPVFIPCEATAEGRALGVINFGKNSSHDFRA